MNTSSVGSVDFTSADDHGLRMTIVICEVSARGTCHWSTRSSNALHRDDNEASPVTSRTMLACDCLKLHLISKILSYRDVGYLQQKQESTRNREFFVVSHVDLRPRARRSFEGQRDTKSPAAGGTV